VSRIFRNPDFSGHRVWPGSARRRVMNTAFFVGPRQRVTGDRRVRRTVVRRQRTCQSHARNVMVDNKQRNRAMLRVISLLSR